MRQPVAITILYAKRMEPKNEMCDLTVAFAALGRAEIHDAWCMLHTLLLSSLPPAFTPQLYISAALLSLLKALWWFRFLKGYWHCRKNISWSKFLQFLLCSISHQPVSAQPSYSCVPCPHSLPTMQVFCDCMTKCGQPKVASAWTDSWRNQHVADWLQTRNALFVFVGLLVWAEYPC